MPDRYGSDHAHTVEYGIRCVKMDPIVVLMAMGMATKRLGLAATCSTTYYEPFHVARLFATLDLMTGGRAAWNVVTSRQRRRGAEHGPRRASRARRCATTAPTSSWRSCSATGTPGTTTR